MRTDMQHGSPAKTILLFSLPVICGNLFQQFYNTMDAVILGKFEGELALAAIGVANPIISVATFILFGMCVGVSVLLAQLYGAGDTKTFQAQTATALWVGLGCSIVLLLLCFFGAAPFLRFTNTPAEVLPAAVLYLRIVSVGLILIFLYHFYASALRALGDSRTPFYFLVFSSVLNILLDFLFVGVFDWSVAGAALATVLAQGAAAFLCILRVYHTASPLALSGRALLPVRSALHDTISYSYSVAFQQSCIYLGRLAIQSIVNTFGTTTIAAFNAATRVEYLGYAPMDGMATAAATFYAQNKGAQHPARIRQGFRSCILIALVYSVFLAATLFFLPETIMSAFTKSQDAAVIQEGAFYLRTMSVFYFLGAGMYTMQGFFRGMGHLLFSFLSSLSQILLRILIAYLFAPQYGILAICGATIAGWLWMFLLQGTLTLRYFLRTKSQTE